MMGYRIVKTKFANSAFTGQGAKQFGGRWNRMGSPMVYLASSISLAMLECLVHLESARLTEFYSLFSIEIDDRDISSLDVSVLPAQWRQDEISSVTADMGSQWIASKVSVGLRVPSVIVPQENNLLLNPQHPKFERYLTTVAEIPHAFDERLK
ncbi:RES family NAD+ phosphorylase [Hafnia alvei]|jgi:RES domain-containing protein|uniref:RES family NAD+ phosphorylase n=1 Tax=Hafnia alvei TaxID=569 RepID=UPI0007BCA23C|nr:RES family NAD+ phosphorylase [Hafnia alvei]MDN5450796.1 RES family NAD+ phosphorylase [Enterobacterales bacterium]ANC39600.1 hypothetical protein A6V27_04095 [Hafnia alvei]KAA0262739.1 RES domain-containing protein [Hafnia alvei]MDN6631903.1 RES family NAD+ phosphorylase [Enterobacterales bacterium]TBL87211.1 RES domain-containing protein [Hafnia alvei]